RPRAGRWCRHTRAARPGGGFFFSSRRRHTRFSRDWSSDVCSSDLYGKHHNGEGRPPACPTAPRTLSLVADPTVRVPAAKVALSTASVYPESTATAFEIAARLGYDGVEVMVWTDPVSQDIEALRRLSDYH